MSYDERLGDYIDVPARIAEFRSKYPDGSLQPANLAEPYRVETIGEKTFIVVIAAAYRSPDDGRPGIGMAYEQFPGKTPYTRDSELQNAETSAWGRAIVAALAADTKRGIASAEEVRNRRADQEHDERPNPAQARQTFLSNARSAIAAAQVDDLPGIELRIVGAQQRGGITQDDLAGLIAAIQARSVELLPASAIDRDAYAPAGESS